MKKEMRERLRRECMEVYDETWADYIVRKTSQAVEVHGHLMTIERQRIRTSFCFGYSLSRTDSEDYDRANRMASKAYEDTEYFKTKNMEDYQLAVTRLKENLSAMHGCDTMPDKVAVVNLPKEGKLCCLGFRRATSIIEANGPCFVHELPGKELDIIEWGESRVYIPTKNELLEIIAAYESAMREHEKKVDNYLKRYGLSKVRAWSYWRDE